MSLVVAWRAAHPLGSLAKTWSWPPHRPVTSPQQLRAPAPLPAVCTGTQAPLTVLAPQAGSLTSLFFPYLIGKVSRETFLSYNQEPWQIQDYVSRRAGGTRRAERVPCAKFDRPSALASQRGTGTGTWCAVRTWSLSFGSKERRQEGLLGFWDKQVCEDQWEMAGEKRCFLTLHVKDHQETGSKTSGGSRVTRGVFITFS